MMVAPAARERKRGRPVETRHEMITQHLKSVIREGHMDLRGSRLHYRIAGQGPALLLLHGWALDGRLWTMQLAALARRFRVVVVDRRGYGLSTGQPSIEREVADLRVFCRRLGLRNLAVLGMSQATRVALRLAQSRSIGVTRILLDGPPEPPRNRVDPASEDPPLTQYRALAAASGLNAFRRAWAAHPLLRLYRAGTAARHLLVAMGRRYAGRDLMARHSTGPRGMAVVPERIRQPALLLCGEEDLPYRLDAAATLARQLPKGKLKRLPRAGHLPNLDAPREYLQALDAFLRRHPGAGGRRP